MENAVAPIITALCEGEMAFLRWLGGGGSRSARENWIYHIISSASPPSSPMECGAAEATGLGFVCFVVSNPRVLSANRVVLGFSCFINYPPPCLLLLVSWNFLRFTPPPQWKALPPLQIHGSQPAPSSSGLLQTVQVWCELINALFCFWWIKPPTQLFNLTPTQLSKLDEALKKFSLSTFPASSREYLDNDDAMRVCRCNSAWGGRTVFFFILFISQ